MQCDWEQLFSSLLPCGCVLVHQQPGATWCTHVAEELLVIIRHMTESHLLAIETRPFVLKGADRAPEPTDASDI